MKQLSDEYILPGVTPGMFTASDIIVTYTPVSDEGKAWLDKLENGINPFKDLETITFWGISRGLANYSTVLGQTVTLPEVDAILIERHAPSKLDGDTDFASYGIRAASCQPRRIVFKHTGIRG